MRLTPSAQLYGGRFSGDIRVQVDGDAARMNVEQNLDDVNLAALGQDLLGSQDITGTGDVRLNLVTQGQNVGQMRRDLDGDVAFTVTNGSLEGIDLWYELRRGRARLSNDPEPARDDAARRTTFSSLSATGVVEDALLTNRDLNGRLDFMTIDGTGTVNLLDDKIDFDLKATMIDGPVLQSDPEMVRYAGNVLPLRVTGTIDAPSVLPDFAAIVRAAGLGRSARARPGASRRGAGRGSRPAPRSAAQRHRAVRAKHAAAALGALVASALAAAATIDELDVTRQRGRYSLDAEARLDATPESIFAVLTDFDDNAYSRISRAYKESRYLEPAADGTPVVYTRMEGCALWHCMSLERTERLETDEPYWIKSTVLPESSNFKHSMSEWRLEPDGDGTMMTYKLEMEPDFFVPPVVGPWYLKRTLSQGGLRAVARIERLARELDGRPVEPLLPRTPPR